MKQLSRCYAFVFIVSAFAVVSLAGCNSAGMQSSTPAVNGQSLQPDLIHSSGEKKVGQYVWVWHTEKIHPKSGKLIEADCPVGYAATGGGYYQTAGGGVYESHPNGGFDGWEIQAGAGYSGPNTVTAYAGCAPAK